MADAVRVCQYLLSEAASGTAPGTAADNYGDHDLDVDCGTADAYAEWDGNAQGNGWSTIGTDGNAVASISDMSGAGSIGAAFKDATQASITIVANVRSGHPNQHRGLFLGPDSGNGDIAVVWGSGRVEARFGADGDGGEYKFVYSPSDEQDVFQFVVDTNAAAGARIAFWLNNVAQSVYSSNLDEGVQIDPQQVGHAFCLGNRGDLIRQMDMTTWYAELCTGAYTTQQRTDIYNAVALNHDADPWPSGPEVDDRALLMMGTML